MSASSGNGPSRQHTFMFNVALSSTVGRLGHLCPHNPVVTSVGENGKDADSVPQHVDCFPPDTFLRECFILVIENFDPLTLVIFNTQDGYEWCYNILTPNRLPELVPCVPESCMNP